MAKKKKVAAKAEPAGKTRLELRFDSDLAEKMKSVADEAGISVNQMVQGIVRWAMARAVVGEPYRDEFKAVRVRAVAGCIFFGEATEEWDRGEAERFASQTGEDPGAFRKDGQLIFALDFTERRVVRE